MYENVTVSNSVTDSNFAGDKGYRPHLGIKFIAICDSGVSEKCGRETKKLEPNGAGRRYLAHSHKIHEVIKDVPKGTTTCPDCGYALFWQPERGNKKGIRYYG